LEKPIACRSEPHLDYHDCARWVEKKLGKELRNYAGYTYQDGDTRPYQDFWHYVIDQTEIHNGCYFYLTVQGTDIEECEPWQKEILATFAEEFSDHIDDDLLYFWVDW
jgi:hypothetical protein